LVSLKLHCRSCGQETDEELGFCMNCRLCLFPKSTYDLTFDDFAYGPDRDGIAMIKTTRMLPYLVKNLTLGNLEKNLLSKLAHEAYEVPYPSDLDALVRHCAISLSLDAFPRIFIINQGEPNAFTFGSEERAFVVVDSSVLKSLTASELTALFAHELTHVKSGHMLFHTVAELLVGGIGFSASLMGLDLLSLPIRLALLNWHRESEVTADRGSLLIVNDISVIQSLMSKLSYWSSRPSAYRPQDEMDEKPGMLESASELFRTHPSHINRYVFIKQFYESEQFLRVGQKLEMRLTLLRALIPLCRFCGTRKATEEMFCPSCGKCQT